MTSVAVLFVALTSPPPEMVAVLVTDAGALGATFTVSVTGPGNSLPGPGRRFDVHVTVAPLTLQVQPAPLAVVGVRPAGTVSIRLTAPLVGDPPALVALMV